MCIRVHPNLRFTAHICAMPYASLVDDLVGKGEFGEELLAC